MAKSMTAVILVDFQVPDDWDVQKLEYHLTHGYVELGNLYNRHEIDDLTDSVNIEHVAVRDNS